MVIQEYVDIKDYSTLHVGGQFRYFSVVSSIEDLLLLYAIAQADGRFKDMLIFVLGGGSNIVFSDGLLNVFALKIEIKGFEIINYTDEYIDIKLGGGEIWDEVVSRTVDMNLSGLESLSAIPGTVGATPVQNVGAYGSEVKDTILEVEVFDIKNGTISIISNIDCHFDYRDSIFKHEAKGKYIVTAVTYRLNKLSENSNTLKYPGVLKYFEEREITNPTLNQIREAVINIRSCKLPDLKEYPNVGSFFKNPIIIKESFLAISRTYGGMPHFDVGKDKTTRQDLVKIPAGWLIENADLKGKSFGKVSVYNKNAVILVNNGEAIKDDFINARNKIIKIVEDKFGIILEQEPEII